MDRHLSSRHTMLYKYLLPVAVLIFCSAFVVNCYLHYDTIIFNGVRGGGGPHMWLWASAVWLGIAAICWFSLAPLKYIELDGDRLLVSNYWRDWRVPLSSVADIKALPRTRGPVYIRVTFKEDAGFGRSLKFLPRLTSTSNSMGEQFARDMKRAVGLEA
jgi:hypothetical protein